VSTESRRPISVALAELDDLKALLRFDLYCERWEVCGSIRRRKPDVGDVDICCIPKTILASTSGDLFVAEPVQHVNALWARVDDLVRLGSIAKAIKETASGPRTKWGEKSRAILFRNAVYEINCCDADNFGPWVAIRTGPAELSHLFAKQLGAACRDGFHVYKHGLLVKGCTEAQFFDLAGLKYIPPEAR